MANEASTSALMDHKNNTQEEEIADVDATGNQPHIQMEPWDKACYQWSKYRSHITRLLEYMQYWFWIAGMLCQFMKSQIFKSVNTEVMLQWATLGFLEGGPNKKTTFTF